MSLFNRRRVLCACAVVALTAAAGCRAPDASPYARGANQERIPPANELPPPGNGSGTIGAFGYQPDFLDHGHTGNGEMDTAGLPARGGGPTDHPGLTPYSLAPTEDIGSPVSDGTERVVIDPATQQTVVWSQSARAARHHPQR